MVVLEKEIPAALAGATGTDLETWFATVDHTLNRQSKARVLARAVADCDPGDRVPLLESALEFFSPGEPIPAFDNVMAEASLWADWATITERKCYLAACFNRLSIQDRGAFLDWAQERAAA